MTRDASGFTLSTLSSLPPTLVHPGFSPLVAILRQLFLGLTVQIAFCLLLGL